MRQRLQTGWDEDCARLLLLAADFALPWFRYGFTEVDDRQVAQELAPQLPHPYAATLAWKGEARDIAAVLLHQSGLFIRTADDRYRAYHRTFLEYLTAYQLARQLSSEFPTTPVPRDALLRRLTALHKTQDPGGEQVPAGSSALALIRTKPTSADWTVVLSLIVGILNQAPVPVRTP